MENKSQTKSIKYTTFSNLLLQKKFHQLKLQARYLNLDQKQTCKLIVKLIQQVQLREQQIKKYEGIDKNFSQLSKKEPQEEQKGSIISQSILNKLETFIQKMKKLTFGGGSVFQDISIDTYDEKIPFIFKNLTTKNESLLKQNQKLLLKITQTTMGQKSIQRNQISSDNVEKTKIAQKHFKTQFGNKEKKQEIILTKTAKKQASPIKINNTEKIFNTNKQIQQLKQKINSLKDLISQKDIEIFYLKKQTLDLKQSLQKSEAQLKKIQENCFKIQRKQKDQSNKELVEVKKQLEKIRQEYQQVKSKNLTLNNKYNFYIQKQSKKSSLPQRQNKLIERELQKLKAQKNILKLQFQLIKQKGIHDQKFFQRKLKKKQPNHVMSIQQRHYLKMLLEQAGKSAIKNTKHIYSFRKEYVKFSKKLKNPHIYIDGKTNILLLIRLCTDRLIGGFLNIPIQKGGLASKQTDVVSFLFNATMNKKFEIKEEKKGKAYIYQPNYLILGGSDIRITINDCKIQSYFGMKASSFSQNGQNQKQFIDQQQLFHPVKQYNFFQIQFENQENTTFNNNFSQDFTQQFNELENSIYQKDEFLFQKKNHKLDDYNYLDQNENQNSIDFNKIKSYDASFSKNQFFSSKQSDKNKTVNIMDKPINKYHNYQIIQNVNLSIQAKSQIKAQNSIQFDKLHDKNKNISCEFSTSTQDVSKTYNEQFLKPELKHKSIIVDFLQQQQKIQRQRDELEQQLNKIKDIHKELENKYQGLQNQLQKSKQSLQSIKKKQKSYDRYFSSSELFHSKHNKQKKYIVDLLEDAYRADMTYTKLIYKYDLMNKVNFHQYIDNVAQLIVIVKTTSGKVIGGYTHEGFRPNQLGYKGFIFSATDQKNFQLNPKSKKIASTYDPYYIIFGNSQLRIKTQDKVVFSNFGIVNNYFLTNGENVDILIGQGKNKRQCLIQTFQIYQVSFSSHGKKQEVR